MREKKTNASDDDDDDYRCTTYRYSSTQDHRMSISFLLDICCIIYVYVCLS